MQNGGRDLLSQSQNQTMSIINEATRNHRMGDYSSSVNNRKSKNNISDYVTSYQNNSAEREGQNTWKTLNQNPNKPQLNQIVMNDNLSLHKINEEQSARGINKEN